MNVTNELKNRVLVAGATGYLGRHLIEALQACDADFKAQARSADKLKDLSLNDSQIQIAQVTDADSLKVAAMEWISSSLVLVSHVRKRD